MAATNAETRLSQHNFIRVELTKIKQRAALMGTCGRTKIYILIQLQDTADVDHVTQHGLEIKEEDYPLLDKFNGDALLLQLHGPRIASKKDI